MNNPSRDAVIYDSPAIYQIRVRGRITPTWLDRLEGLAISSATGEDGSAVTILEGELRDQAALAGVLNSLYELHLSVLLVKRENN